ncbi:MAG: hypothetical protein A2V69_03590 [Candidatus Portnoybacteria bacterium RBG_13_40_8]|uniref:Uncharacterized protein n=1 Tax=Candidatus Portnoybacteria bacterium RBG_13_40_8 TaxID=1801990 RepID=A0A1G2F1V0_9BACT|nr:MAG: hypothetical protein A2V69_03590 [Candidatus Portnoybacteria bacterium RBG_13_40_8]
MINSTKFGEIVIDDKKYHQVLIIGDKVEERDYKKLEDLFNTSHKIGDWEIEKLISNNPEIILIGTGQNGAMASPRLSDFQNRDGGKGRNIELIIEPTPKAISIYNEQIKLGKRVNALIHTTC